MTIDVYYPDGSEPRSAMGSRVFLTDGEEVKSLMDLQINKADANGLITATITVMVGRIGTLKDIPADQ